jgi:putative oxygen-independent coproporphyrinogen III oxidase
MSNMNTRRTIPIVPVEAFGEKTVGSNLLQAIKKPSVGASGLSAMPPLTLYIHVPWCVRKCPYCDFNSHRAPEVIPEEAYLDALAADLEQGLPLIWGRQIHAVFIGGGTPSLLSSQAIDRLLAMIRAYLPIWPDAEITLEANPGTAEAQRFKDYAQSGVNRISLGIQSFNDIHLTALGRVHNSKQARAAIEMAQDAVKRVNLDLMYGLPGQTLEQCADDLSHALAYNTEHLSLYQLTLEPNTVFAKYPPALPDDDSSADMEDLIQERTTQAGFDRYEVSAYAKNQARAQHNFNYWTFGDYLGIGPGAHSKISSPDRIERLAVVRSPEQWLVAAIKRDGSHWATRNELVESDMPFEFMLNALRLKEGVAVSMYEERTGQTLSKLLPTLAIARQKGLLDLRADRLVATPLGWRFLNTLQSLFIAPK